MSRTTRVVALLSFTAAVAGCASFARGKSASSAVCLPRQCALDVQNDNGRIIGVRYFDSTGAGEALGSVKAGSVQRFELGVRTSRKIVVEVSREGQLYRATATLSTPPSANVLHFPLDFQEPASR